MQNKPPKEHEKCHITKSEYKELSGRIEKIRGIHRKIESFEMCLEDLNHTVFALNKGVQMLTRKIQRMEIKKTPPHKKLRGKKKGLRDTLGIDWINI